MALRHQLLLLLAGFSVGCSFDTSGDPGAESLGPQETAPATSDNASSSGSSVTSTSAPGSESTTPGTSTTTTSGAGTTTSSTGSDSTANTSTGSTGQPATGETEAGTGRQPLGLGGGPSLVRYFLDEAAAGTRPAFALDDAESPLDLPITYAGELAWATVNQHRGLEFFQDGTIAVAGIDTAGTKLALLAGATEVTFEVVLAVSEAQPESSRILHIGSGEARGDLTLATNSMDSVELSWENTLARQWPINWSAAGRVVLHLVIDLGETESVDRALLFVNGSPVGPDFIAEGDIAGVPVSQGAFFGIGNRNGQRSIGGVIYYAAVYPAALSLGELGANASILEATDDLAR